MNTTATPHTALDAPQFSGQALRRIRHDRGISLTEMGYLVGRSSFTIGRYETGSHRPDADVLGKLAAILGIPVQDLFAPEAEVTVAPRHRKT
jgi:transcriptional regulator with XRE-family HTH domain